ncbi:MAG TPA: helix-turn-helix domain-containing protein [Nocardioides sp.]|nr:helix-turn-helix domain-containing protein [Nocardioides sp.]
MPSPEEELRGIAVLIAERSGPLTRAMVDAFEQRIAELPRDPALMNLLEGSSSSNLETLAHLLHGHVPISEITAPSAAVEYARRLAQRGTPASALLRAYRLGQQMVLAWAGEEISQRVTDPDLAYRTVQVLMAISFDYIDAVSEGVVAAYQEERERWLANRSAVQRETVEAVLAGERVDLAVAEAGLGYRLRQHHLGLVLWTDRATADAGLADAEQLATAIARHLVGAGQPLFVPRDRETAWAWIPLGRAAKVDPAAVDAAVAECAATVHLALGVPAAGEEGFRSTHEGALAAQTVAQLGGHRPTPHSYADPTVRAAALLARDLPATRRMVQAALGELAHDSEPAGRTRETLLAFLEERESYVATAARLHLHKNTVRYRVEKALESRGRPLSEDRLDLELGLIACRWLGAAVLPILGT